MAIDYFSISGKVGSSVSGWGTTAITVSALATAALVPEANPFYQVILRMFLSSVSAGAWETGQLEVTFSQVRLQGVFSVVALVVLASILLMRHACQVGASFIKKRSYVRVIQVKGDVEAVNKECLEWFSTNGWKTIGQNPVAVGALKGGVFSLEELRYIDVRFSDRDGFIHVDLEGQIETLGLSSDVLSRDVLSLERRLRGTFTSKED